MLVEVIIAGLILAIVSTAIVALLVSTTSFSRLSNARTVAEQGVANQIEMIRAMDYTNVGTTNGNPAGTITPSQPFTGLDGRQLTEAATMTTQITFVGNNVPGTYVTNADYKKIVVKIIRNRDSVVLAQGVTYLAPPVRPAKNTATIDAQVVDEGTNAAIPNVTVNLATGPSAPRSAVSDAGGDVEFAGLTPNPTTGPQAYYDLSTFVPAGYVADTVNSSGTHVQLAPTQTQSSVLFVYQPATLVVNLQNTSGGTYTGAATVIVSSTDSRYTGTSTLSYTGTSLNVTTLGGTGGRPLLGGIPYTVKVNVSGNIAVPATQTVNMPTGLGATATASAVITVQPTKLVFKSTAVSGSAATSPTLGPITVQQQDATGTPVVAFGAGTAVDLSSTSGGGLFATTSGGPSVTTVTIPAGQSSTTFYYGDTVAGSPTIRAHNASIAADGTQVETISAAAAAALEFTTAPLSGASSSTANLGPITLRRVDAFGNPATSGGALAVSLSSNTTGTARFSLSSGGATTSTVTIAAGASSASFYYGDTKAGTPTITAHSAGVTDATQQETTGAANLVFTSSTFTATVSSSATKAMTVQRQDVAGNAVTTGGALTITLSSTSTGDTFSATSGGSATTTATIAAGQSSVTFYYGDTVAGTPGITAHTATLPGDATQTETMNAGAATALDFVTDPVTGTHTSAFTCNAGPIKVGLVDQFGNATTSATAVTVSLSTNRANARLSTTQDSTSGAKTLTVTIAANGTTSTAFYLGDKTKQAVTITANWSGHTPDATQVETMN
ncbi:MAG TPA: hypothetical protein VLJ44_05930 [Gaiellaceae bacterium]|nr:hypothetical protein [Gaiellaceae bacterium]